MEKITFKYVLLCLCPVSAVILGVLCALFSELILLVPMIILIVIVRYNMNFYEQFETRGLRKATLKQIFRF